jgi:hypothetical protein
MCPYFWISQYSGKRKNVQRFERETSKLRKAIPFGAKPQPKKEILT